MCFTKKKTRDVQLKPTITWQIDLKSKIDRKKNPIVHFRYIHINLNRTKHLYTYTNQKHFMRKKIFLINYF